MKGFSLPVILQCVFAQYLLTSKVSSSNTGSIHPKIDAKSLKMYDEEMKVAYGELNHGKNYYEGDIVLTRQQKDYLAASRQGNDIQTRNLIKDTMKLWPSGVVPYVIASDISGESRGYINSAIKEWSEQTCLQFRPKTDADVDYIEFVYKSGEGCSSNVGRIGGKQTISVGSPDGITVCRHGNIVHEIAHSLGFFHEHTRPDRDQYIDVLWNNVESGKEKCFEMKDDGTVDSRGVGYDYDSIMHYGQYFFSKDRGLKTINPKDPGARIGQRVGLSEKDVRQANILYNCGGY